jgi:hypothetical protein
MHTKGMSGRTFAISQNQSCTPLSVHGIPLNLAPGSLPIFRRWNNEKTPVVADARCRRNIKQSFDDRHGTFHTSQNRSRIHLRECARTCARSGWAILDKEWTCRNLSSIRRGQPPPACRWVRSSAALSTSLTTDRTSSSVERWLTMHALSANLFEIMAFEI